MKSEWKYIFLAMVLGIGLPWIIYGAAWELIGPHPSPTLETHGPQEETTSSPDITEIPVILEDGNRISMGLNEYLTGVLLKELPEAFEVEAKKAQAVAARTYTLRTIEKHIKHEPGAVCTNPGCCQGYISVEDYLSGGGKKMAVEAARGAVEATDGYVLTFEGSLIDATYFSCSGGYTEDALAVWGSDIPYLQAVESPGEEHAAHYTDTVSYTADAFENALGVTLSADATTWFGETTYTKGGGVDVIYIGGIPYKGTTLRKALGLPSTAFTVTATKNSVVITTKGFGHRVGMSQYGADAMAAQGSTWREIVTHYYHSAVIDKWVDMG